MPQEYVSTLSIGDVEIDVRHIPQPLREEILDRCTVRGELNQKKYRDEMADAHIAGWRNLTPLDAFGWGFYDYESLTVAGDGTVPHSQETARRLYRECDYPAFRHQIEVASANIMAELARQKKAARRSSGGSLTPSA